MGGRRERMEIILYGSRPWGFSIKGGSESNKPLVISKLEPGGKAESSGLCVGDIIFSVNNVPLSGVRSEAIKLVKTSGRNLMLEIERGALPSGRHDQHYQARSKQQQYSNHSQEKHSYPPTREGQRTSYSNIPAKSPEYPSTPYHLVQTQNPDLGYSEHTFWRTDFPLTENPPEITEQLEYPNKNDRSPSSRMEDDVTSNRSIVGASACEILSSSPSSVCTFSPPRACDMENRHRSEPKLFDRDRVMRNDPTHFVSSESVDRSDVMLTALSHCNVRMRRPGKARDRNTERPSSWHASKHSEFERNLSGALPSPTSYIYEERIMRSPGSPGLKDPQHRQLSSFYYQPQQQKLRRKSKGWLESGDLKSTFKGEINGSKDSLISSSSQHSCRSGRLSISSSRSSGNMSSSRGSLDNLDTYHVPDCQENIPEIDHRASPANAQLGYNRKNSSPSQLQIGNVDSKKNMFEKLSHKESNPGKQNTNRDYHQKNSSKTPVSHDTSEHSGKLPWRKQYHEMTKPAVSSSSWEGLRSPSFNNNSRKSSFSPPSSLSDKGSNANPKSVYMKVSGGIEPQPYEANSMTTSDQCGYHDSHDVPSLKSGRDLSDKNTVPAYRQISSENTELEHSIQYADAKIVKTTFDPTQGTVTIREVHSMGESEYHSSLVPKSSDPVPSSKVQQLEPPSPPLRDSSSTKGVLRLQDQRKLHPRSNPEVLNEFNQQRESMTVNRQTNGRVPVFPTGQSEQTAVVYPVYPVAPSIASPVTEDQKTMDNTARQGRMFGVTAYGDDRKNVVAKAITISSPHQSPISSPVLQRTKPPHKNISDKIATSPPRYEHLKDTYTYPEIYKDVMQEYQPGTDYVGRMMAKKLQQRDGEPANNINISQVSNFTRSDQNKARASGRYGEIWKTPQIHRRSKSSDANSIINNAASITSSEKMQRDAMTTKLSVFKPHPEPTLTNIEPNHVMEKDSASKRQSEVPFDNLFPSAKCHIHQSSFDAKSRRPIYQSSEGGSLDEIARELDLTLQENETQSSLVPLLPRLEPEPGTRFTNSSIVKALQKSGKCSSTGMKINHPEPKATSPISSVGERTDIPRPKKKSATLPPNCSPSFKEVDLDEPEDDDTFMSQNDEYRNNIKGMSKKVLRVTSFTRKDLELSPSFQSFEQRRQLFEFSKLATTKEIDEGKKQTQYLHGRSRSQGNELEEGSVPIMSSRSSVSSRESILSSSGKSEDEMPSHSRKLRPLSAGAQRRQTDHWHAPKLRQTVLPVTPRQSNLAEMKAGSLPRNLFASSLESDSQRSPPGRDLSKDSGLTPSQHLLSAGFISPEHKWVEMEIHPATAPEDSVKLSTAPVAPQQVKLKDHQSSKDAKLNAVIGFYKRKTGKMADINPLRSSRAKSTSNFHTHQTVSDDKQTGDAGSSGDEVDERSNRIRKPDLIVTGPSTNNFRQIIARFSRSNYNRRNVPVRAKSTSSLLDEEGLSLSVLSGPGDSDHKAKCQNGTDLSTDQRASSLENLTADSITPRVSTISMSHSRQCRDCLEVKDFSPPQRTRSSSDDGKLIIPESSSSSPSSTNAKVSSVEQSVQPPPRTRRQRFSHSSSASSATTVSTLSSYSSSSSTSIGASSYRNLHHHPPLEEQDDMEENSDLGRASEKRPSRKTSIDVQSPTHSTSDKGPGSPPRVPLASVAGRRVNVNMGTYKITKGLRKTDPSIKIPVVYPEDSENISSGEPNNKDNRPVNDNEIIKPHKEQPSPQIPQRRHKKDHTSSISVTSTTSSSSSGSNSLVTSPQSKKSSLTEMTPSPSNDQRLTHRVMSPSSKSPVSRRSKPFPLEPLPPPPPPPPDTELLKTEEMRRQLAEMGRFPKTDQDLPPPPDLPPKPHSSSTIPLVEPGTHPVTPTVNDPYRDQTYLLDTDSHSNPASKGNSRDMLKQNYDSPIPDIPPPGPTSGDIISTEITSAIPYENINLKTTAHFEKAENYENVCVDILRESVEGLQLVDDNALHIEEDPKNALISSRLNEDLAPSSLTNVIIRNDKTLAQVLSSANKKTLDYMHGILPPSRDIVEEGIRYRKRKPANNQKTMESEKNSQAIGTKSDPTSAASTLPASSTYYQTSASKAKIMNLVQEKVEEGEIDDMEEVESEEEINGKKVELVSSISDKMAELQSVKDLIKIEMKENEELGKQVNTLAESICTPREHEKFNTFVEEVDKIINLLLSLSGRLARVENALVTLGEDATAEERNSLLEKKEKLTQQHEEAKLLKENVDKRQKAVSEILAAHLNTEQFADYEHYIKMKTALIMEQRELDDKMKLGEEQMQCLRDSLPDDWQRKLDKILEERSSAEANARIP